jgi:cob(I)alamin adenosyltransferase
MWRKRILLAADGATCSGALDIAAQLARLSACRSRCSPPGTPHPRHVPPTPSTPPSLLRLEGCDCDVRLAAEGSPRSHACAAQEVGADLVILFDQRRKAIDQIAGRTRLSRAGGEGRRRPARHRGRRGETGLSTGCGLAGRRLIHAPSPQRLFPDCATMGHRLSKIYTRTGDAGTTGLADGSRVAKDSPRIAAMGESTNSTRPARRAAARNCRRTSANCSPASSTTCSTSAARWHPRLDAAQGDSAGEPGGGHRPLERPTGTAQGIHPAGRHASRRAGAPGAHRLPPRRAPGGRAGSRRKRSETGRQYLNRLSDLLFVLGRYLNKVAGGSDVLWQKGKNA